MKKVISLTQIAMALMIGAFIVVATSDYVQAAVPQKTEAKAENKQHKAEPSFRRPRMSMEDMQTILYEKYGVINKDEIKNYIDAGVNFRDLDRACLYAYMTKKPVNEILTLKKELPWTRVQYKLGLTAQKFHTLNIRYKAERTHHWWGFDEKRSYKAMMEGYPWHWVKIAWIMAEHSDFTMEQILASRKYSESWIQWAGKNLNIDADTYNKWIDNYKNPSYIPPKFPKR